GKLVPPLVKHLIKMYSNENDLVLANFAGSGTILVEANLLKRKSIGIDSNPLSYLLCKVKTTPYVPKYEFFLEYVKNQINQLNSQNFKMTNSHRKGNTQNKDFVDLQLLQKTTFPLPLFCLK
ncbi:MAG: DNA methyltransferase, partial [Candidatus Methanofastidiosia archaeon]